MRVRFFGVRGSVPYATSASIGHGCNTPCIEVFDDATDRLLILDAGSGIVGLGETVTADRRDVPILLTHYHWDHVQGLPFFAPLYRPGGVVNVWAPALGRTCRRSSHRRSDLGCELFCVARRACLAANVLSFLCVPRGWPHGTDSTRISVGMEASALDPRDFDPDERPLAADSAITKVSRTNRPGAILRNGISLRPNTRNQAYGSTLFWSSFG